MAFGLKNVSNKIVYNKKQSEDKEFICKINKFIYKDEESSFFVILVDLKDNEPNLNVEMNNKIFSDRKFTIVGNSTILVQSIVEGQEIEVWGNFEEGRAAGTIQFAAKGIRECIPTKPKAIEIFLSSGKIIGIGPKIAKKIVQIYGAKTIDIFDNEIEKLLEIEGISLKKLAKIEESWKEWRTIYEIISTMKIYGIGDAASLKIFNYFKEKSLYTIQNEPYNLTDVPTIGFKTADKIAQQIGISPNDPNRIEKCILYTLEEISEKGHTAYPKDDLIVKVNEFLTVENNLIEEKIHELIEKDLLIYKTVKVKVFDSKDKERFEIIEKEGLSHKKFHNTELRIAKEMKRIMDFPDILKNEKNEINEFLELNPNNLDKSQLDAAKIILSNKISILTGGPGTGKTHTIKSLLEFFNKKNETNYKINKPGIQMVLGAPTGRASKRMYESTGFSSSTLHRILGFKEGQFLHNETNQLKGDVFVIDESSMMDIWLTNGILKAIPSHARIIFVGDANQLPSVGAGNVLKDLIDSSKIPVATLNEIHRQALNSQIIIASHDIINKKLPELHPINSSSDFVFVEQQNNEEIHKNIIDITKDLLEKGVNENDIQILTPKKETEVGTNQLNHTLRDILNPNYKNYKDLKTKFVPGDRVMQFKNNKDLEIFNGDIGTVVQMDAENDIYKVKFDDRILDLDHHNLNDLNLSFATTIHKSQGSDYPYVIIPLSKSHTFMWDANLLYTATTRGKKRVILVGDKKTLFFSIAHFKQNYRITGLKDLIIEEFDYKNKNQMKL